MVFHFLNILYRQSPSSNFSKTNYEFASIAKDSAKNKKLSYICGLRTRIECEPFSEHSTRSDRVTNIEYRLPVGASVLPTANYYLTTKFTILPGT